MASIPEPIRESIAQRIASDTLLEPTAKFLLAKMNAEVALEGIGCSKEKVDEIVEAELNRLAELFGRYMAQQGKKPTAKVFFNWVEVDER